MSKKGMFAKYSKLTVDRNDNIHEAGDIVQKKKRIMNGIISVFCAGGLITTGYFLVKNGVWKGINDKDTKSISNSTSDDLSSNNSSDIIINNSGTSISNSDILNSDVILDSNSTSDSNTSNFATSNDIISLDDVTPVYIRLKTEDIVKLSTSYSKYLNEFTKLSDKYYAFSDMSSSDLHSLTYLSNISNVNKVETETLIEYGLINENIMVNISNAFYPINLIADDTSNKAITAYNNEEKFTKDDIIDLSLILTNDADIEAYNVMRDILIDMVNNPENREKLYKDFVYYYIMGADIYDDGYDYSQSVFKTDRSKLSVGGDYLLRFTMARSIQQFSKAAKIEDKYYDKLLEESLSSTSNITQVFNDKCSYKEKDKQYTK